jgi:enolase-phosphatase E1
VKVKIDASYLLFDIEGTISPVTFVREVLFPYSMERMQSFFENNADDPYVLVELKMIPGATEGDGTIRADVAARYLNDLIRRDVKDPLLKEIQGRIWKEGYESGAFKAPLYEDVLPAWQSWKARGKNLGIYSSGSLQAQNLFFTHTDEGNVLNLFSHHFDLGVGPKKEKLSYEKIAKSLQLPAKVIAFFSDIKEELVAAKEAGLQVVQLRRPQTPVAAFDPFVTSFSDVIL